MRQLNLQWLDVLIDERAESEPEEARHVAHGLRQLIAQPLQLTFVVAHGTRQIHEEVEIDRIVFGLLELHGEVEHPPCEFNSVFMVEFHRLVD